MTAPLQMFPLHPAVRDFLASPRGMIVDGREVFADSGLTFETRDPSSGAILAHVASADRTDVDRAVAAARRAFDAGPWTTRMTPDDRSRALWRLSELIERDAEILGQLDALDNGKPLAAARDGDVVYAARHFRYFAGWPSKIEGATVPVSVPGRFNLTVREPVGVCGLITPWNYPLLMAAWKIAPALAAGNTIVVKPAEQTPLSCLYLARLSLEAGIPPGVFNVVPGMGETAGAALTEHPDVDKIGFTGSAEVARIIVRATAGNLKRVSLELGGKAANVLLADADLDKAIPGAFWACFGNNGQSCTSGARLYVHRSIHDAVVAKLAAMADGLRLGPGMSTAAPDLGPVVDAEQMQKVLGYIESGRRDGATVVAGGSRKGPPINAGYFVAPTVLTDAREEMAIAREEIFGPVLCVMPFAEPDEVLNRANDTPYGLAAGLWTRDIDTARRFATRLRAGTIWINTWGDTDAASPFGGMRQSGYGREMGREAIELYTNTKSIWVA
jgi:acyl-CoA reductase-like NAD-dependent aldehyde dehydrogenase